MRIAINGFGRIGKTFLRVLVADAQAQKKINVVAINVGPVNPEMIAQMFQYDSLMGKYQGSVSYSQGVLTVDDMKIKVFSETQALKLPWKELAIDWVVDCSGRYTHREDAEQHQIAGAKKVLLSAPAHNVDCTVIPGVNDGVYQKDMHTIVSLGSCTTNALMPMLKVINDTVGIEQAFVVTTHAYTNSQSVLDDFSSSDPRKSRAAALNIIPTTTGASRMVGSVLPELEGRVKASALRVPVPKVSLVEVTWNSKKSFSKEILEIAFLQASKKSMRSIMTVTQEPCVSSDYYEHKSSVIVDMNLMQVNGTMGTLSGWYDNEWGYSQRLKDFLLGA